MQTYDPPGTQLMGSVRYGSGGVRRGDETRDRTDGEQSDEAETRADVLDNRAV